MKKIFVMAVVSIMMLAASASAQETVVLKSADEAIAFVTANQEDTVIVGRVKYFWDGNKVVIARTRWMGKAQTSTGVLATPEGVKKAKKGDNNTITVTTDEGELVFTKTNTNDLTTDQRLALLRQQEYGFNPSLRTVNGTRRKTTYLIGMGGMGYRTGHEPGFTPLATAGIGVEKRRFFGDLTAVYTQQQYTNVAEATGTYHCLSVLATLGWKAGMDVLDRNYIGPYIQVGYGYHRTDADWASVQSRNYGLSGGAGIRGALALYKGLSLVAQIGYQMYPSLPHSQDGAWQNKRWGEGAVTGQLGVAYRFLTH